MENKVKCDGHCENCSINQRSYCAAQIGYYNMQEISNIKAILADKNEETINPIAREEDALEGAETASIEE